MVFSMDRWLGKIAVVTGAACGIGAVIAEKLVEIGVIVVGIDLLSERMEENKKNLCGKKGKLYAVSADISKEEEVLKAFKWIDENLGPVHILINCAGVFEDTSLTDGNAALWKRIFDVNVIGVCLCTREAVRAMRKHDVDGHIVHLNSICGHKVVEGAMTNIYSGSKHAITALTEALRQELNTLNSKIKITSVSPGFTLTEMTIKYGTEYLKMEMPFLKPEDVADGIVYALSTPKHVQVHELTLKPLGEQF